MNIDEFETTPYVRRPFEVQAFEVTVDNIADLAPFIGELDTTGGTPFIKSDKKKVGNTFKVWPGFFVTALKGKVRCYSRKIFFEQFVELTETTETHVKALHGNHHPKKPKPVAEKDTVTLMSDAGPIAELEVPTPPDENAPRCEHGAAEGECNYKKCPGPNPEPVDDDHLYEAPTERATRADILKAFEENYGVQSLEKHQSELVIEDDGIIEIHEGNIPPAEAVVEPKDVFPNSLTEAQAEVEQKALEAGDGIPSEVEPAAPKPTTLDEALAAREEGRE